MVLHVHNIQTWLIPRSDENASAGPSVPDLDAVNFIAWLHHETLRTAAFSTMLLFPMILAEGFPRDSLCCCCGRLNAIKQTSLF